MESVLCHYCGHILSNKYYGHSKTCPVSAEFKCSICKKHFSKWKYLQQHQKVHVSSVYECELCGRVLRSKFNLKIHMNHLHENCEKYEYCSLCPSKFKRKADLEMHKKIHCDKKFQCSNCKKKFHKKYNLQFHAMTCS